MVGAVLFQFNGACATSRGGTFRASSEQLGTVVASLSSGHVTVGIRVWCSRASPGSRRAEWRVYTLVSQRGLEYGVLEASGAAAAARDAVVGWLVWRRPSVRREASPSSSRLSLRSTARSDWRLQLADSRAALFGGRRPTSPPAQVHLCMNTRRTSGRGRRLAALGVLTIKRSWPRWSRSRLPSGVVGALRFNSGAVRRFRDQLATSPVGGGTTRFSSSSSGLRRWRARVGKLLPRLAFALPLLLFGRLVTFAALYVTAFRSP